MLPRTPEPEAMDSPGEALAYDLMDHSGVNARFVADFLAAHGPTRGGEVLDVGTGPARIPILLCGHDRNARVLGVELADGMIELGRKNIDEAGLTSRVRLRRADARALPFSNGAFEAVLCNAAVHHFADPAAAVHELVRVTGPGGTLMIRDLVRPETGAEVARLVELHAGGAPAGARALFAASFHAALTLEEVRAIASAEGLPSGNVVMTSDRHWTWIYRRRA